MCTCGLSQGVHWYCDHLNAPHLWQIAETPEQAEYYLRSWAGKILRKGHAHIDMRPVAARVLSTTNLYMYKLCENAKIDIHPGLFE